MAKPHFSSSDVVDEGRIGLPPAGSFNLPTIESLGATIPSDVSPANVAQEWFNLFVSAVESSDDITNLFLPNGFWRDMLSLSWDFRTLHGALQINEYVHRNIRSSGFRPLKLSLDPLFAPALNQSFPDLSFLRFSFDFETASGNGTGTCRLVYASNAWKAYAMFTALDMPSPQRDDSLIYGDWTGKRAEHLKAVDGEIAVIIIGGGHSGLSVAARLKALQVRSLVVEKNDRIGDNWRSRYKSLCLHDQYYVDQLPYMPYPSTWPVYAPAAKMADWLEAYVTSLDLDVWTGSIVQTAEWDKGAKVWTVYISHGTDLCQLRARHLVFAVGLGGAVPNMPIIPDRNVFEGQAIHSTQYSTPQGLLDKKILVVGAGNSANDIAYEFAVNKGDVTIYQRSPIYAVSASTFNELRRATRNYSDPIEYTDHQDASLPYFVVRQLHQRIFPYIAATRDKPLLDGLEKAGFKTYLGPDNAGLVTLAYETGGGYLLDVGSSQLITEGKIKVKSGGEIERFTKNGLRFTDGSELAADVVIFATGFGDARQAVEVICGSSVRAKLKPVWGLDKEGEISSVYRDSGHEQLWFATGNLSLSRYYSSFLALRIKHEEDLLSASR